jgi:ABC-type multidrug transport system fused ATPase/permease subunit
VEPGQLWLGGCDAARCDLDAYRRHFSFAPQKALLFSTSLRDNLKIALPAEESERADLDGLLLDRLALAGFRLEAEQFVAGLDTVVGEKGVMLSGGQRQRIALARALLKTAGIYILDDVLSAVDYETERTILANLRRFAAGKSFVVVSHRISAVQWADEILVFGAGRIIGRGAHAELMRSCGHYRDVAERQANMRGGKR